MSSASLLGLRWTVLKLCKAQNVRISLQSVLLELVLVSFKLLKEETKQSKMPESTIAKERKEERAKWNLRAAAALLCEVRPSAQRGPCVCSVTSDKTIDLLSFSLFLPSYS